MIWFDKNVTLEYLNKLGENSLAGHLGIEFTAIGEDSLTATMPVDQRTMQPYGRLHGGSNVALAETMGSVAALLMVDKEKFSCVGIEVNANHLRAATKGFVTGICTALHIGRTTQVWNIEIKDERGKLTCASRLTVAVIKRV